MNSPLELPITAPLESVTRKVTPLMGVVVPVTYFAITRVVSGSFSKSRLLPPVLPLVTVLVPFFSVMVWGVVLST